MAEFSESDYFPILTAVIRRDAVVPFDSFILLRTNQRVVVFSKAGEVFPEAKLEKLRKFKFDQLHILKEDKPAYFRYLDQFSKTEEGQDALRAEGALDQDSQAFKELPQELQESLGKVVSAPAEAPDNSKIIVTGNQAPPEESLIQILQDGAKAVEEAIRVQGTLTEEETTTVEGVTDRIEEEIQRVLGKPEDEEGQTKIKGVTDQLNEEITRISGVIEKNSKLKFLGPQVQKLQESLDEIIQQSQNPDSRNSKWQSIQDSAESIQNEARKIKEAISKNKKQIIEKHLAQVISGLETNLNAKLKLDSSTIEESLFKLVDRIHKGALGFNTMLESRKDLPPELRKGFHTLYLSVMKLYKTLTEEKTIVSNNQNNVEAPETDLDRPVAPTNETNDSLAKLKDVVEKQNRLIADLQSRLGRTKKYFSSVVEVWHKLQSGLKDRMDIREKISSQEFSANLQEFDTHFLGLKAQSDQLMALSDIPSKLVGVETAEKLHDCNISQETALAQSAQLIHNAPDGSQSPSTAPSSALLSIGTLEIPPPIPDTAGIDEFKAENKVLRLQLENAKSLIDLGNSKIDHLQKLVDETGNYTSLLERETQERKEETQKQIDKVDKTEFENKKLAEGANEFDRMLKKVRLDLGHREESLQNIQTQLDETNKELQTWKAHAMKLEEAAADAGAQRHAALLPEEFKAQSEDKDKTIKRLQDKLDTRMSQFKEMHKEVFKLKNQLTNVAQLKKEMSDRFEKLTAEKELFRQSQDGMNRKVTIIQDLLDKARKTVMKITEANEQLRKERIESINKTNQALKSYKDMINRTNTLSNHVQAEMQRNQSLGEMNESVKDKNKELMAQVLELQKTIKIQEIEKKKFQKALSDAEIAASGAGAQIQLKQLQYSINTLTNENKRLVAQVSEEKAKAMKFERLAKNYETQIAKKGKAA